MRRLFYTIPLVCAQPLTAYAGAFCDAMSGCVTASCYILTFAGCLGGWITVYII